MARRRQTGKVQDLPFRIDRNLKTALADQVADGLRQCILSGRYGAGDILPSLKELVAQLGVSQRVAREAIHHLVAEGLAMVRPRSGCRVLAQQERSRRGRILAVMLESHRTAYFAATFISEMERLLAEAGFVVETVYVRMKRNGAGDFSQVCDKLRSPFDLVFSLYAVRALERFLAQSGIPYVPIGSPRKVPGSVLQMEGTSGGGVAEFAQRCTALGVRTAWVATYGTAKRHSSVARALEAVGIAVEWQRIPLHFGFGFLEAIEHDGYANACSRFADGRRRPDVAVVMDDYYLRGVLAALRDIGIKIPGDMRLVGLANAGFMPATSVPLACFLADARKSARDVADALLSFLAHGSVTGRHYVGVEFRDGTSLSA